MGPEGMNVLNVGDIPPKLDNKPPRSRVDTCRSVSSHEDSTELYMLYYDPQTRSDRGLRQGAAARRQYTAPHVQS
jgi:hypothetical protein